MTMLVQVAFEQSWPVSFSGSAFGSYLTVALCSLMAIVHDDWNDIHTSLLNHLESYREDGANPYVLAAGTEFGELEDSLECRAAEGAPCSQWFHDTWHGQLVTDLYNVFLISAEKVGGPRC